MWGLDDVGDALSDVAHFAADAAPVVLPIVGGIAGSAILPGLGTGMGIAGATAIGSFIGVP